FIKGYIKGISVSSTDQFPSFAFGINFSNPAPRCHPIVGMASWIHDSREQLVLIPNPWKTIGIHFGDISMIPGNHVDGLFVRRQYHAMRSLFTWIPLQ